MPDPTQIAGTLDHISRDYLVPWIADHATKEVTLLARLWSREQIDKESGKFITHTVMYKLPPTQTVSGYGTVDVSPVDTTFSLQFGWGSYTSPITVSLTEQVLNEGAQSIANLLKLRAEEAKLSLTQRLGADFYAGQGTAADQLDGLDLQLQDTGTYGGQSRTTYPTLKALVDSTTTTLTAAALNSMVSNLTSGGEGPTVIVSGADQYNRALALREGEQRWMWPAMDTEPIDWLGAAPQCWAGIPWIVDTNASTGSGNNTQIYFLNENWIRIKVPNSGPFYSLPFTRPHNQVAWTALIVAMLNLVNVAPYRHGRMTAVTS